MKRARLGPGISFLLLTAGAAALMLPLWTMVAMSLKTPGEIARTSALAWPARPRFENYAAVVGNPDAPFGRFFVNTLVIATLSTIGVSLSCSLVAYAFARLRFVGRDRLFLILLATMMLPGIVTMIPTYVLYRELRWINTSYPLWAPAFFGGGAFNVFLLRQYLMSLPRELDEAALLDGAGHATIYARVLMPLARPALATVAIFTFVGSWRDFMGPLLYLNSPERQTLEVGLRTYQSVYGERWELVMAGAVLVMVPLVFLFVVGQRAFTKGIVMSGLK